MADPQIVNMLRPKRDEIERVIAAYEANIEAARIDVITSTLCFASMSTGASEPIPGSHGRGAAIQTEVNLSPYAWKP